MLCDLGSMRPLLSLSWDSLRAKILALVEILSEMVREYILKYSLLEISFSSLGVKVSFSILFYYICPS